MPIRCDEWIYDNAMRFFIQLTSGSARSSRDMAKAILACKNPIFDPQSNRSPEKLNQ